MSFIKYESKASKHINIAGHFNAHTLIDKDGHLIRLFEVKGIDPIIQPNFMLDVYKHRLNSLFKTFSSGYALYAWVIRQKGADFPSGDFKEPFAKSTNDRYAESIQQRELFQNKIVLALVSKPPMGKINQAAHLLKTLSLAKDKEAKSLYYQERLEELNQLSQKLISSLSDYQVQILQVQEDKHAISKPLSFIQFLMNGDHFNVPLAKQDASSILPRHRLFFNSKLGVIEIRRADESKQFAAILSIKHYTHRTKIGMLNEIQQLPIEFILTQSFLFFDAIHAKRQVKDQGSDLEQTKDEAISQQVQLTDTLDEIASGEAGQGLHHLSLLCFAQTQQQLNQQVADIIAAFSKLDIICIRETTFMELAFWAQLPGNFSYIPRQAPISTKNLASFLSFHSNDQGKKRDSYWGDPVTLLETINGSPYYFNFHFKDVGNCLCFGSMGSGKTTLIGFLLLQSLKFGGKRVVFDKDRGLDILIRALGGNYEILKPGVHTGFNPCQLPDTQENRSFLNMLLKKLLTIHEQTWSEADAEILNKTINRLYQLPVEHRRLCNMVPFFGSKTKGSLRARLEEWVGDGNKAWVFDNEKEHLNLEPDLLGFDLSAILDDPECKTPVLMYLMHRVTRAIEGVRGGIFIDEGWKALSDPYFKSIIEDLGRTPRKKNNFLCLSTQASEDTANTHNCKALNQSAACKIFFPNPQADRKTYVEKLGLTDKEYELIKTLDVEQRYFLLSFGHGKSSTVVRLNLKGMEDLISVISGRESTVKLLDQIREEVGNDPSIWLPAFQERCKVEQFS